MSALLSGFDAQSQSFGRLRARNDERQKQSFASEE
jgi:hypothetical protein